MALVVYDLFSEGNNMTKRFYSRDWMIRKAVEYVTENGFSQLSSRKLAKEFGCSLQPIYTNFKNMDEVRNCILEYMCHQTYRRSRHVKKKLLIETTEADYLLFTVAFVKANTVYYKAYRNCWFNTNIDTHVIFKYWENIYVNEVFHEDVFFELSDKEKKVLFSQLLVKAHGLILKQISAVEKLSDNDILLLLK